MAAAAAAVVGLSTPALVHSPHARPPARPRDRVRILRVIARMNLGGPAHHVSLLSGRLDPDRYETLLVSGRVGPGEASSEQLAELHGARLARIEALRPEIAPGADARTLTALTALIRRFRPHVVHTHTAKAGMVGRAAALTAGRPRPVVVHTYHGHVLEGYFGAGMTRLLRETERLLGRASDCLVGVSQATVDDLVRLGVAPRPKFRVVPLGLDLEPFLAIERAAGARFRAEIGASDGELVATFVGRLVPIKRVDRILRALAAARERGASIVLAVVGDGELREELERLAERLGVGGAVRFVGYRRDLAEIAAGSDVAVLASDNEGTPVWLIEAAAAGVPAVTTDVGGVREVVRPDTGIVVPRDGERGLADALVRLAGSADLRSEMGARAREHVRARYSAERLLADVDRLYGELLERRGVHVAGVIR